VAGQLLHDPFEERKVAALGRNPQAHPSRQSMFDVGDRTHFGSLPWKSVSPSQNALRQLPVPRAWQIVTIDPALPAFFCRKAAARAQFGSDAMKA
jgi:hypothetical protein